MKFKGTTLAVGTGFICKAPGGWMLVTARHNVTGKDQNTGAPNSKHAGIPDEIYINFCFDNPTTKWIGYSEQLYVDDFPRWHEHPKLGAAADFVALPINPAGHAIYFPVLFEDGEKELAISPAEPVSVVGFPFGITAGGKFPVWATGFLASEPEVDFNELPIQLIDCRTRPGQSGAPVIAYRAGGAQTMTDGSTVMGSGPKQRFIGLYSGRINKESDIGYVWKAQAIRDLIDSIKSGGSEI